MVKVGSSNPALSASSKDVDFPTNNCFGRKIKRRLK